MKKEKYLCIGGYNDGQYHKSYDGPRLYVAKQYKFKVNDWFNQDVGIQSSLKVHTYELEEFKYPPNKSVFLWRWDQLTLEEMIYKLIKNYGVPREEVGY